MEQNSATKSLQNRLTEARLELQHLSGASLKPSSCRFFELTRGSQILNALSEAACISATFSIRRNQISTLSFSSPENSAVCEAKSLTACPEVTPASEIERPFPPLLPAPPSVPATDAPFSEFSLPEKLCQTATNSCCNISCCCLNCA